MYSGNDSSDAFGMNIEAAVNSPFTTRKITSISILNIAYS